MTRAEHQNPKTLYYTLSYAYVRGKKSYNNFKTKNRGQTRKMSGYQNLKTIFFFPFLSIIQQFLEVCYDNIALLDSNNLSFIKLEPNVYFSRKMKNIVKNLFSLKNVCLCYMTFISGGIDIQTLNRFFSKSSNCRYRILKKSLQT
jgi:hypothetical protein